jgi:hypothetical protein
MMRPLFLVPLMSVAACLTGVSLGAPQAAIAADGSVTEFNGRDLTGWQTEGNWVVDLQFGKSRMQDRPLGA